MAALQQSAVAFQTKLPSQTPPVSTSTTAARSVSLRSTSSISAPFPTLHLLRRSPFSLPPRRNRSATMMGTTASSYAAALADVAQSTGTLEETCADMEKVSKLFSDRSIIGYLANPTIRIEKKESLIEEIGSGSSFQPHTTNFLKIVVDNRRSEMIGEIAREFEVKYNKITGTEVAVVTSVVALESQHLTQIAKTVQKLTKAKNVRIKTEIDPKLVAGFTIRYGSSGSKLIDMSIKKQLEEIANQLQFEVELLPV